MVCLADRFSTVDDDDDDDVVVDLSVMLCGCLEAIEK
jgi:hypothetical protein